MLDNRVNSNYNIQHDAAQNEIKNAEKEAHKEKAPKRVDLSAKARSLVNWFILNPGMIKHASRSQLKEYMMMDPDFINHLKNAARSNIFSITSSLINNVGTAELLAHQDKLLFLDPQKFQKANIIAKGVASGKYSDDSAKEYLAEILGCNKEDLNAYSAAFIFDCGLLKFKGLLEDDMLAEQDKENEDKTLNPDDFQNPELEQASIFAPTIPVRQNNQKENIFAYYDNTQAVENPFEETSGLTDDSFRSRLHRS